MTIHRDKLLGCFIGLAVGDALGSQLEFKKRDTYEHVRDYADGGPFKLKAGQWTDDTSMAICLAQSIIKHNKVDRKDLIARWRRWQRYGENSSTGSCFDIGSGTAAALRKGRRNLTANGNGSIMRLAPVMLRWPSQRGIDNAIKQSNVTHGLIAGRCAQEMASMILALFECRMDFGHRWYFQHRDEISSSGFVDDTLTAACWAVASTQSFEDALIAAVNLGDDADTIGAVTGQLAGALYGYNKIPPRWLWGLHDRKRLCQLADKLIDG